MEVSRRDLLKMMGLTAVFCRAIWFKNSKRKCRTQTLSSATRFTMATDTRLKVIATQLNSTAGIFAMSILWADLAAV